MWTQEASVLTASVFANPGTPSKRTWPLVSKPDQETVDQIFLAHDHPRNFILNGMDPMAVAHYFLGDCLCRNGHMWMLQIRHSTHLSV